MSKKRTKTEKRLECMIWRLARRVGKAYRLLAEYVRENQTVTAALWRLDWCKRVEHFLHEDMVEKE